MNKRSVFLICGGLWLLSAILSIFDHDAFLLIFAKFVFSLIYFLLAFFDFRENYNKRNTTDKGNRKSF